MPPHYATRACLLHYATCTVSAYRPPPQVGMRFMHPVHLIPVVELAKGLHTSDMTFKQAKGLAEHLGKTVCVSEDRPGFLLHRLLMPMINEAIFCMMEVGGRGG